MTIRVGVFGAGGRMGQTVCHAIAADPALALVAAVDPFHAGIGLRAATKNTELPDIELAGSPIALAEAGAQVAVDFTVLDAARTNVEWCALHGVHAVVGTTGFTADDYDRLRSMFQTSNCVIAPNFTIGGVLMMRFAELAAPFFETAEIIEYHHNAKIDAPSGTAMMTAQRMAAASAEWAPDPTTHEAVAGARGAAGPAGIHVHAVRLKGPFANQEVILGTQGQTLTIRHDSYDRTSYMPGVLLAVKAVAGRPGLTVGLDSLLGL